MLRGLLGSAHKIPVDGRGLRRRRCRSSGSGRSRRSRSRSLILVLAAIAGNMIQHRLVWSAESLKPKLSKISPGAGFKRLFSKIALANFVKGLIKLALIGAIMAVILWPKRHQLDGLVTMDPAVVLLLTRSAVARRARRRGGGARDRRGGRLPVPVPPWYERQKMSLREMKEEFKQTEGDPAIKAKIRQLRVERMKKRMMAAVPKASVIITNPTHYAVALQYDRGMDAPICVAKGLDNIALKIREVARRARHPDRREPAARPRAARHRRDRRGDPARALQGGGRGDRLRDAAQGRGAAMKNPMSPEALAPLARRAAARHTGKVIRAARNGTGRHHGGAGRERGAQTSGGRPHRRPRRQHRHGAGRGAAAGRLGGRLPVHRPRQCAALCAGAAVACSP